jgi:hypothetical protein
MEATVVEQMTARGELPASAGLADRGMPIRLESCLMTFPDAIWAELMTGRAAGKIGCYWHPHQVHAGEARQRALRAGDVDLTGLVHHAAAAGKRVGAVESARTRETVEVTAPGRDAAVG